MKTFLRLLFFTVLFAINGLKINAQCTVSDVVIQNIAVAGIPAPGTCTVTFDVSFNIEDNNGNKYIFIHAWLQGDYPDYFHCINGSSSINGAIHAPQLADLEKAFLTIGINNDGTTPQLLASYTPDPLVPLSNVNSIEREVLPDGSANFILHGVIATVPVTCGTPVTIIADLWSSQASQAQVAHCVNCGFRYGAGFLTVAGLANCLTLTYNAVITNQTDVAITGFYRVYADINHDNHFTPATDTLITDTTNFTLNGGIGTTTAISGSIPAANSGQSLFIVITQTSGDASGASVVQLIPSAQCIPLPITFRSFTANRTNQANVLLKWETATETNNNGFALQRNMGNNWQTIAYIKSQATDGNSDSPLMYTYADMNTSKGITQYRVQQVDIDGKSKISEIRAVRGEGQKGKTIVYPNPSFDGRVNVVFENVDGTRDIVLTDISGRIIRQWKNISGNTIQADNLQPGIYSMRIVVLQTGDQSVENSNQPALKLAEKEGSGVNINRYHMYFQG